MEGQRQEFRLALDGTGGARALSEEERLAPLPTDGPDQWVHLNRDDAGVQAWLRDRTSSGVPSDEADSMLAEMTRPHIRIEDNGVLGTLRGVNLNPDAEMEEMIAVRMWITPHALISVARHRFRSIEDVKLRLGEGNGPKTVSELLVAIIMGLTMRMEAIVDEISETVADIEDRVIDPRKNASRTELVDVRLRIITLLRYLTPQNLAIEGFTDHPDAFLDEHDRDRLRDANHKLKRYIEDLAAARDRATVVQDEVANQAAEAMNTRTYMLTLIAGLVLPIGAVTGLLGINVGGMPGADNPNAFWYVTGGLVLMVVVSYVLVRRKKWL